MSTWSDDLVPGGRTPQGPPPQGPPPQGPPPGPPTLPPVSLPAPTSAGFSGGVAAIVVVVLVVALAVPAAALAAGAKGFWPAQWDPRLAPITERDTALRGLSYEHAVPVVFLSDKAFVELIDASDKQSASDRAETDREAGTLRSLDLINGKADLQKAATVADDAGILAFYDDQAKEVVIRGTTLDVSHRATLAHELTHVLQDQHFDLPRIEERAQKADAESGDSAQALTALVEGDANHVEQEYVKALPLAQRKEYDREQAKEGATVNKGLASVPPFVSFLIGAPYEFGPFAIRVLIASGGNSAVNDALTGPTPTSAIFVQAGLVDTAPEIPIPPLAAGERADGQPESFGAFELYLALSMHLAPLQALTAADSVLGGPRAGCGRARPTATARPSQRATRRQRARSRRRSGSGRSR